MTIRAYRETYLNKVQSALGDAFDYAINTCGIPGEDFIKFFITSSVSKRIENGEPAFLAGKSGIEIAVDVVLESTGRQLNNEPQDHFGRTREYWIGWAVCYYQWFSARSFNDIFKVLSFEDLQSMYYTLHEDDISKFVEIADERIREHFKDTNLKRIRTSYGCTQAELQKAPVCLFVQFRCMNSGTRTSKKPAPKRSTAYPKSSAAQLKIFSKNNIHHYRLKPYPIHLKLHRRLSS